MKKPKRKDNRVRNTGNTQYISEATHTIIIFKYIIDIIYKNIVIIY